MFNLILQFSDKKYAEIDKKAEELASLDKTDHSERERWKDLSAEICAFEYSLIKPNKKPGTVTFPLVSGTFEKELFFSAFNLALAEVLSNFDPNKASFRTALRFRLEKRLIDEYNEQKKHERIVEGNYETSKNDDNDKTNPIEEIPEDADFIENLEEEDVFDVFIRVAPLIAERKRQELHLDDKRRSYFESFYTFDTTCFAKEKKVVRNAVMDGHLEKQKIGNEDDFYYAYVWKYNKEKLREEYEIYFTEEQLMSKNDLLFPIMEETILSYLMQGEFKDMSNVSRNELKDSVLLTQRNRTIENCYPITGPTVSKRKDAYYNEFLKALSPTD